MSWDRFNDLTAGAVSGAVGVVSGHSLDTLKVRAQISTQSTLQVLRHMALNEGVSSSTVSL